MQPWPVILVGILARIAAFQLLTWFVLQWGMRRYRLETPEVRRLVCLAVLAQGCLFLPWTVSIPWYDPLPVASEVASTVERSTITPAAVEKTRSSEVTQPAGQRHELEQTSRSERSLAASWNLHRVVRWTSIAAVIVWLLGILAILVSMLVSYGRFLWGVPRGKRSSAEWQGEWLELLAERGIRRSIPFYVTERHGPMLCLLPWGYSLLVPEKLWKQSTPSERAFVLRHEIAHYERGDVWKSWLIMMLAIPNWFNPVAWRAVRSYLESAELACDRAAARSPAERVEYARLLQHLMAMHLPLHPAGRSAHSHPLVSRVCYLLSPSEEENSTMKKTLLIAALGALLVVHAVRVQLVAKDGPMTREAAKERIAEIDGKLAEVAEKVTKIKASGEKLAKEVETRKEKLKELAADPGSLSGAFHDRVVLLQSGSESSALEALDGVEKMGDEGVLVLAFAVDRSTYKAVRQKALSTALKIGKKAYPVIAHVFKNLSEEDRLFLVSEVAKTELPEKLLALASMSNDPSDKVRKAALDAGCKLEDRVGFVALYVKNSKDDPAVKELVRAVEKFKGDEGVMLLYAAAGADKPELAVAALKEAAKRGMEALPVLKPAYENLDPAVRAEVVRMAKKLGGEVADFVIEQALQEVDPKLRAAAEKALQEKDEVEAEEAAEATEAEK